MKELRPPQIEDLAYLMRTPRGGLFHDPAVGKTPPVCVFIDYLWTELKEKTIFLGTLSILEKNRAELMEWTRFSPADVQIVTKPRREVQYLLLLMHARYGALTRIDTVDTKMIAVLLGKAKHKAATNTAVKNGWIVDGKVTDAGRQALDTGLPVTRVAVHYPRTQPKFVGNGVIAEMIERALLKSDLSPGLAADTTDLLSSLRTEAKVLLMGFDFFADNWEWLKLCNPDIDAVIGDELHLGFGHNDSQRTQSFYEAMRHFKRFIPMTGTLINGRLDTTYPTIHVINPHLYANYQDFMNQHQVVDIFGKRIGWTGHDKLAKILPTLGRRRTFEEEYGPEAKVLVKEQVDMSPAQRSAYDEFHEKAMLELEDRFLDGTLPGVAVLRARQIMQCPEVFGLCKGEETGKDGLLRVHLDEASRLGKPIVIFSAFHAEQNRIVRMCEEFGLKVGLINGTVSGKQRAEIDRAYRAGELEGIVGTEATAGVGLNWERTDIMVFASMDYQDGNFRQAYLRAIRGKRTTPLLLYILEYLRSVDQRIFQIVEGKSLDAHRADHTREVFRLSA